MTDTISLKISAAFGATAYCLVLISSKEVPLTLTVPVGAISLAILGASLALLWFVPVVKDDGDGTVEIGKGS